MHYMLFRKRNQSSTMNQATIEDKSSIAENNQQDAYSIFISILVTNYINIILHLKLFKKI